MIIASVLHSQSRSEAGIALRLLVSLVLLVIVIGGSAIWLRLRSQQLAYAGRTHCVGNLIHIRLAKALCAHDLELADGDLVPANQLDSGLSKPLAQYSCPNGGDYIVGPVGASPACTFTSSCSTIKFDWRKLRLERREWFHSVEK